MNIRKILPAMLCTALIMSACTGKTAESVTLSQQEMEINAIAEWFSEGITDSEEFEDLKSYQYYARAIGLDKDAFLSADMWEVFYNEDINLNRDIDEKAVYLIRLDPHKLIEIYAQNNKTTVEKICKELSVTPEQLYYNFGYTATSVSYSSNHENYNAAYSDKENNIFGKDNGEKREKVFSTHFLVVDVSDSNSVTYKSSMPEMEIRQRDLLKATTKPSANYSDYTEDERNAAFVVNGIGIRRVIPLSIPNGVAKATDTDVTVMYCQSPYSYGCTDSDKVVIPTSESEVSD